jgi:two-component system, NarL family, sensor kinase
MHKINQEILFTIVLGSILLIGLGTFIVVFLLQYQKRKFRHRQDIIKLQGSFQQNILTAQLEIKEQTLKNISQEVHDNIGQVLSLAKLNLATADINHPDAMLQKIEDSKTLVAKAIQDLRDLSKSMNTDYIADMGFARAVEYEMEMIKKTGSFETGFEISGTIRKLEAQKELILFRIVQEVLNNIIKHSRATMINIKLQYELSLFSLQISDNGEGFDLRPLQENSKFGLGIRNMKNRAQLIGAQFEIISTLAVGTTVNISLPFSS